MESSKMKNMVVLRNLPSNLVEEAIIILKSSKKVKRLEKIDKKNKIKQTTNISRDKDYVLKEAEMLVSGYISKLENNKKQKEMKNIKFSKKYLLLKRYAYISSFIIFIQIILLIIK